MTARWRHPWRGPIARACDALANSPLALRLGHLLPAAGMSSDITSVIYVNYLVDIQRLAPLASPPLAIQPLGPGGRFAMFSFLTYRHGHFGPTCFGPLRRLWPSPIQSNWRIYVVNPATGTRGVQFLTTAITSTPHALAARLLTDGVPMHVPADASLSNRATGKVELSINPGAGSGPDAAATLTPAPAPTLAPPWNACFGTWREMLEYCVPQDRAMCVTTNGRVLRQEIELGIPLDDCRPLSGDVESKAARAIAGDAAPLSFIVDRVAFRFTREEPDRAAPRGQG